MGVYSSDYTSIDVTFDFDVGLTDETQPCTTTRLFNVAAIARLNGASCLWSGPRHLRLLLGRATATAPHDSLGLADASVCAAPRRECAGGGRCVRSILVQPARAPPLPRPRAKATVERGGAAVLLDASFSGGSGGRPMARYEWVLQRPTNDTVTAAFLARQRGAVVRLPTALLPGAGGTGYAVNVTAQNWLGRRASVGVAFRVPSANDIGAAILGPASLTVDGHNLVSVAAEYWLPSSCGL